MPGFGDKYSEWDKVATDLVAETEKEEEKEAQEAKEALGLDGRIPRSKAEEEERQKAEIAKSTKQALDQRREMEEKAKLIITETGSSDTSLTEVVLDNEFIPMEKRVLTFRDCVNIKFILPLESAMKDTPLIKIFIEDCKNCTFHFHQPLITSMVEVHRSNNIKLKVFKYRLSTIQLDLCENIDLQYMDVGCFGTLLKIKEGMDSVEDRIYHAGVSNMQINVPVLTSNGVTKYLERSVDYRDDGAVAIDENSAEEYQFITYVQWEDEGDPELVTEQLHRIGRKMVKQSELDEHMSKGEGQSTEMIVDTAKMRAKIQECEEHRLEGNEAFKAGNYGQAVLCYSLAIDKSSSLTSKEEDHATFTSRHVCFSNRAACFLKLGHHEKALGDAEQCLLLEPTFIKGLFRKGMALHAMGKYSDALPILGECLKIEPKNKQVKQAIQFCEMKLEKEMRSRMNN